MRPELGIIEGFYGRPWSSQEREETIAFLARRGYRFYLHAPKAEPFLRERWREPCPEDTAERLAGLVRHCRELGVRFGVGLSPLGAFHVFDEDTREALARKLAFFDRLGVADLAILFDDVRGDVADLADRQAEIVHWAAGRTRADRIIVCPTYYTDDPFLDHVFGRRPAGYLGRLGELLDPRIEVFWAGEEICAREFSPGHLDRVAGELRRRPFLWDNYPVNDGPRMSGHLHVRAFTGRPASIGPHVTAHGINGALQPVLTRVPALTLVEAYERGAAYEYEAAGRRAAREALGERLGAMLLEDRVLLHDTGLDRLGEERARLRKRYGDVDHSAAREIVAWLDGVYAPAQDFPGD